MNSSIQQMDAVILCGGLGTRLRSVDEDTPKVMMDIGGRPFLDIWIEHLYQQGVKRVVLCTGYKADMVESYYRKVAEDFNGSFVIDFAREESPLGTGGALLNAEPIIYSDSFFLLNGDSFCAVDFSELALVRETEKTRACLTVSPVRDKSDSGSINCDGNRITSFLEKNAEADAVFVNSGVYCLTQDVFSRMPDQEKFSLEYDCFPAWIEDGVYAYKTQERFWDIGTPQRLQEAIDFFQRKDM